MKGQGSVLPRRRENDGREPCPGLVSCLSTCGFTREGGDTKGSCGSRCSHSLALHCRKSRACSQMQVLGLATPVFGCSLPLSWEVHWGDTRPVLRDPFPATPTSPGPLSLQPQACSLHPICCLLSVLLHDCSPISS